MIRYLDGLAQTERFAIDHGDEIIAELAENNIGYVRVWLLPSRVRGFCKPRKGCPMSGIRVQELQVSTE